MAYGAILGQKPQIPQPVDTVQQGNMNAVTSNAVYEAIQGIAAGLNVEMGSYIGDNIYPKVLTTQNKPYVFFLARNGEAQGYATIISNTFMWGHYDNLDNFVEWGENSVSLNTYTNFEPNAGGSNYSYLILTK